MNDNTESGIQTSKDPPGERQAGITRKNMLFTLPRALKEDESTAALADATAEVMAARLEEIDRLRIIPNVDRLDEGVLDILARDFKVDWWDAGFTLEEKRRTLKSSWRVHKTLGTQAAVEEAICAIYPDSRARPWFDYGGEPYHFRFEINASGTASSLEKQARVLKLARYYQSQRDRLDEIHYTVEAKTPVRLHLTGVAGTVVRWPVPEVVDTPAFQGTLRLGGGGSTRAKVFVPERADTPAFRDTLRLGSGGGVQVRIPTPAGSEQGECRRQAHLGGQYAAIATIPVSEI